jgi:coenzyme F420-dependent glucose-6-phosphate dehydrogenase
VCQESLGYGARMTMWGYTLSSEEHAPTDLVRYAVGAEEVGFDFLSISDHFHPWIDEQGHSPFVWGVLGAVANATKHVRVGTGVTCPILRTPPALVAHAAATASLLFEGRFFLGVGAGEALNEHVMGQYWPPVEIRHEMLAEALKVMRELWKGDVVDFHGTYFTVENARIYDAPDDPIPVVVSAFGPKAAEVAAKEGDGIWMTSPRDDVLKAFADAAGRGPRIGQVTVCWAPSKDEGLATVKRVWPNTGLPGQLAQDLPTPSHFEQAAELVREEDLAAKVPCGPDPEPIIEKLRESAAAGLDHVHVHQVGPDQDGFIRFWDREVRPKL